MPMTQAERSARFRERNAERVRTDERLRRENETPEQRIARLARMHRYRDRNPDGYRADVLAQSSNRRAKRLGIVGRIRGEDVLAVWERDPLCIACGTGRGLDHIVPMSKGGANAPGNLQNLCKPCNTAKENDSRRVADEIRREGQRAYNRAYYQSHRGTHAAADPG